MMIPFARIGKERDSEVITVEELSKRSDLEKIKRNLYCENIDCLCPLTYFTRLSKPFLKTWNKHDHIDECMYHFERDEAKKRKLYSEMIMGTLSDEDIRKSLKRISKEAIRTRDEGNSGRNAQSNITKKKSKKISANTNAVASVGVTVVSSGEVIEKNDHIAKPRVRQRRGNEFSEIDINTTRRFSGTIIAVDYDSKTPIIQAKSNGIVIDVILIEAFFAGMNDIAIENIYETLKLLDTIKNSNLLITVQGEVHKDNRSVNYQLYIYNPVALFINTFEIVRFKAVYAARQIQNKMLAK